MFIKSVNDCLIRRISICAYRDEVFLNKWFPLLLTALFINHANAANPVRGLDLEGLLADALKTHPAILAKKAENEGAQSELVSSKLRFLPAPSIASQRNEVTYNGQTSGSRLPATTISITQPLLGGGMVSGYQKASARLSASDYRVLEARQDIARRLIAAYSSWCRAYLKVRALEVSVRQHQQLDRLVTRRLDAGIASGADADLSSSRLEQAQADLDAQIGVEATSLASISQLVGYVVQRKDLVTNIAAPAMIPRRNEAISRAIENSVTLERIKFESQAAEAEADEVRAQALPQVSFQALRQIGNAYVPGYQGYDAYGLVFQYSPGNGFGSAYNAKAAYSRAAASRENIEVGLRDLTDTLNATFNEYDAASKQVLGLQKSVELAGRLAASYDRQYSAGRRSWLDLMNAVRERTQSQMALADAKSSTLGASWMLAIYVFGTEQFDNLARKVN